MSADQKEIEYAKIDGVHFELMKQAVEISDDGILYYYTEFGEDGKIQNIETEIKLFPVQSIIVSISQGPRANIVSTTKGIELGPKGLVQTNENGETTRPGVFASGDVVTGAKTVVEAVRVSKKVADAIDAYVKESMNEDTI